MSAITGLYLSLALIIAVFGTLIVLSVKHQLNEQDKK